MRALRSIPAAIRNLALATGLIWSGAAARGEIAIISSQEEPLTGSLFDSRNGTTVTGASATLNGVSLADAFGATSGTTEPGHVIFADGAPAGTVDFLDFRTPDAVHLGSFRIYLADDSNTGSDDRGISAFRLFAGTDGGPMSLIAQADVGDNYRHTYGTAFGRSSILVAGTVDAPGVQDFRLEFVRTTGAGPRILEIGGFTAVPEPSSLALIGLGLATLGGITWRRKRLAA